MDTILEGIMQQFSNSSSVPGTMLDALNRKFLILTTLEVDIIDFPN